MSEMDWSDEALSLTSKLFGQGSNCEGDPVAVGL
jgi:hypothetical protein